MVSVLLKIRFGYTQVSVPKIGISMSKTAFIFIYVIKTVTLFITYTLCNSLILIFNLEKVQSYRRNNSIQTGKVNAKL